MSTQKKWKYYKNVELNSDFGCRDQQRLWICSCSNATSDGELKFSVKRLASQSDCLSQWKTMSFCVSPALPTSQSWFWVGPRLKIHETSQFWHHITSYKYIYIYIFWTVELCLIIRWRRDWNLKTKVRFRDLANRFYIVPHRTFSSDTTQPVLNLYMVKLSYLFSFFLEAHWGWTAGLLVITSITEQHCCTIFGLFYLFPVWYVLKVWM